MSKKSHHEEKDEEEIITPVIHEQLEDDFDIRAGKLESEIAEKYNEEWVNIFKRLAYETAIVGLPLPEACMIVGVDFEKLSILMKNDPIIERLIKTKNIEYKRSLLKTVSTKAKTDEKMSQWLLQARYPDEFNPRKGSAGAGGGDSSDLLGVAIEFIQKSGDSTPLVTERSGKITMVKRTTEENKEVMNKISKLLK
jgi:hypothetical protein